MYKFSHPEAGQAVRPIGLEGAKPKPNLPMMKLAQDCEPLSEPGHAAEMLLRGVGHRHDAAGPGIQYFARRKLR
jgi:hypothetical protein